MKTILITIALLIGFSMQAQVVVKEYKKVYKYGFMINLKITDTNSVMLLDPQYSGDTLILEIKFKYGAPEVEDIADGLLWGALQEIPDTNIRELIEYGNIHYIKLQLLDSIGDLVGTAKRQLK